jgi:PAS domain S-box-containing protein
VNTALAHLGLGETEMTALFEELPSGVVVVDETGRTVHANHAARGFLDDASSGPLVIAEWAPVARALAGETVSGDDHALSLGTESIALRVSAVPLRDASGAIRGAVVVLARTEEPQSGTRAELALQSSQQRLRLALEASRMGTWDYDVVHDQMEWSAEIASVVGAPQQVYAGSLADGFSFIHSDDRPAVERALKAAIEKGDEFQVETRVVDTNDRVRWLLAKGRIFRDDQGQALRMTGIAMDITERKDAEAARQALSHAERLRALGQMASGIAHDLNQSLALISGYSDMARQELALDVPDTARVREMVEITSRAALAGGQRLRGLLSFVRTQELMAESEWIDLGELLRDVARLTEPRWRDATQAEGRPVRVEIETDAGCTIHGSPGALREAFTNLIFNAVDALPEGGTISLSARRASDIDAIVEVRDTGSGIPAELQESIFEPFFTTKGERGTGLGLPQVMAIVERHSGRIELESAAGTGTTFRLRFPIVAAPTIVVGEDSEKQSAASAGRSIRVLVVEDEEQLARMSSLVLSQRGHQVVVARSGEEAIARLAEQSFDLVISDLGLGAGMNGWDVAEAVRIGHRATRFVLVTGWGAGIDPNEARARGVAEVIAKPYRIADLRQIADDVAGEPDASGVVEPAPSIEASGTAGTLG